MLLGRNRNISLIIFKWVTNSESVSHNTGKILNILSAVVSGCGALVHPSQQTAGWTPFKQVFSSSQGWNNHTHWQSHLEPYLFPGFIIFCVFLFKFRIKTNYKQFCYIFIYHVTEWILLLSYKVAHHLIKETKGIKESWTQCHTHGRTSQRQSAFWNTKHKLFMRRNRHTAEIIDYSSDTIAYWICFHSQHFSTTWHWVV